LRCAAEGPAFVFSFSLYSPTFLHLHSPRATLKTTHEHGHTHPRPERDPDHHPRRPGQTLASPGQSLGHRAHCDARHLHGGPRYLHRQRRPAAHRRRPRRIAGRSHLGPHLVPRRQRRHPPGQQLSHDVHRPQKVLHDLRRPLRHQLRPLRTRAVPAAAHLLPRPARRRRWRSCALRAVHPRRHLPTRKTRPGLRSLRPRRRHCARYRPHARRLDHRQLRLALDLLHQRSRRDPLALPHRAPR